MQLSGKSCRHYHAGAETQLHLVKLLASFGKTTNGVTKQVEEVGKQRLQG